MAAAATATEFNLRPALLRDPQQQIFYDRHRHKVVVAGSRFGKALALDTPIPSPDGWTTMAAVKTGDRVFDEGGRPANVLFATETMYGHACYDVVFSDGNTITADAGHLWETSDWPARKAAARSKNPTRKPSVKTTEEIAQTLHCSGARRGVHNHSIPLCDALQYPARNLPIDPYVMGIWLADGTAVNATFATNDDEIVENIRRRGYVVTKVENEPYMWRIRSGFQARLRELGLLGKKRILRAYLESSINQRTALLQGLMDGDGTASKKTHACEFNNTDWRIAGGFAELAIGLGLRITENTRVPKLNGKDCAIDYRIGFTPHFQVFKLSRKARLLAFKNKFNRCRFIIAVRPRPSVPVKCIMVDSPSQLYLAGRSCIPTHNTYLALQYLIAAASQFPRSRNWYICPTRIMAKDIVWAELKVQLGITAKEDEQEIAGGSPMVRRVNEGELFVQLYNGAIIQLMTAQEPDRLRGRALKTVVFDEFADMDGPTTWTAIRPRIGDRKLRDMYGELGRTLFIGTPKGMNHFKDLFDEVRTKARGPEWRAWRFTSLEGGNIEEAEIMSAKRDLSSRDWRQEYEATFESIEGRVYHSFLRDFYEVGGVANRGNLDESIHDMGGPILVGADFNVNPMCWTLSSKVASQRDWRKTANNPAGVQYELHTWKEYKVENCNTQMMMKIIKGAYPNRHIVVHPDPHVGRHTTSANVGETDHSIIQSMGADVYVPRYSSNSDRYNTTNGLLCNSLGHRRGLINPRTCPWLTKCLDGLCFVKGSNLADKSTGYDHVTDAYSYDVLAVFPIVHDTVSMSTVSV